MNHVTSGIKSLDDILRNADTGRMNTSVSVGISNRTTPALSVPDPASARFLDRAMNFARLSRGRDENALFGSFKPQSGNNSTDIRVSIGMAPSRPVRIEPPLALRSEPVSNPTNAKTTMQDGKVSFENDNYTVSATENNQSVMVTNKKTGANYEAWGDPHMKVNGQHAFDFKGTTSLALDDGTKVTIGTADGANGTTYSSKVSITSGDYGVEIKGIDPNKNGDLAFQEFKGRGVELDKAVDDGVTLEESATGNSLVTSDRNGREFQVDQKYIDSVDELATRGKRSDNVEQFTRLGRDPNGMGFASARDSDWAYQAVQGLTDFNGGGNSFSFSNGNGGSGSDWWSGLNGSSSQASSSSDWLKSLKSILDSVDEADEAPPPPPPRRMAPRRDALHVGVNVQSDFASNVNVAVNASSQLAPPSLRLWG